MVQTTKDLTPLFPPEPLSPTPLSLYYLREGGGKRNRETPYDLSNLIPDEVVGE